MSKCPKCGKDIDTLRYYCLNWHEETFSIDKNEPKYEAKICLYQPVKEEYFCPECDTLLFVKEEDAVEFLKGGEVKCQPSKK